MTKKTLFLCAASISAYIFITHISQVDLANNSLQDTNIPYKTLEQWIRQKDIDEIILEQFTQLGMNKWIAYIHHASGDVATIPVPDPDAFTCGLEKIQEQDGYSLEELIPVEIIRKFDFLEQLRAHIGILSSISSIFLYSYMFYKTNKLLSSGTFKRMNKMMDVGKSSAKLYDLDENVGVKFNDVAGCDQAKLEITEFVDFLKTPEKYHVSLSLSPENRRQVTKRSSTQWSSRDGKNYVSQSLCW